MILKLFKGARPVHLFFVFVFAILLRLANLLISGHPELSFEPNPMPFYALITNWIGGYELISNLTTLLLLFIIAIWLSRINTRFIIGSRTYLPAFLFLLFVSGCQPLQQLNPAIFACFLMVYCLEIVFDTYKKEGLALKFFQAAFLVSLASLFYARAAFMIIIIWAGLIQLRAFNWREWTITIFGFAVPYVYFFSYFYLTGQDLNENWLLIRENLMPDRHISLPGFHYLVFYGYILLLILAASFRMLKIFQGLKIYKRKFYMFNFWIFAISLSVYYFLYSRSLEFLYFIAVPVTYVLSQYLYNLRSKLAGDILFGLLLCAYGTVLFFVYV